MLHDWKFKFFKKEDAVEAYDRAFPNHRARLKRIFADENLFRVSLVRNAIVHNAGRIPESFVKSLREYSKMREVKANDPVPIDGEVVYDLSTIAIRSGLSLLDFVDQRVKNFPK